MTYLPSEYIDSNYKYYSNGTYFTVRTNKNCYSNYNSTYCDCVYIYPQQDYLVSNTFSCTGSNNQELSYTNFSDVVSYRLDFVNIAILIFLILFGMLSLFGVLCSMLFKGVFK